ncbi:tail fiber domain-containing protein [Sinorhizobium medicae]
MSFSVDTANVTTGGGFTWNHNGLAGAGTLLLTLQASNGNLFPGADGTQNLGNASFRYATVFAATGTINTSDERDKIDVALLSEAERLVALRLKGLMRRYRFRDAYDVKGENARVHVGIIAQDVVKAFEAEGLSAHDYGMLCFDSWEEAPELRDDDGNIVQDFTPAGDRFGVRYDELLAFIVAAI